MSVEKSQVVAANRYLSTSEMQINAQYIAQYLSARGWTINAIAATLANMQTESTINPGIYESLDSTSSTNGFGLVQWTPNTKYKTWADSRGYTYEDIDAQLGRIIYELENGLQWISTDTFPLSFPDYTQSQLDVAYLTYAFMYNYERPASLNQPQRQENARQWLSFIGGSVTPSTPSNPSTPSTKKGLPLIYQYLVTRRQF